MVVVYKRPQKHHCYCFSQDALDLAVHVAAQIVHKIEPPFSDCTSNIMMDLEQKVQGMFAIYNLQVLHLIRS